LIYTPHTAHPVILRRAPGHAEFDFGQVVPLFPTAEDTGRAASLRAARAALIHTGGAAPGTRRRTAVPASDFITPVMPCGSVFEVIVHSTWGDPHYVGLGAIEVIAASADGSAPRAVRVPRANCAGPSVRDCPDLDASDPRTPDRLFDRDGCVGGEQGQRRGGYCYYYYFFSFSNLTDIIPPKTAHPFPSSAMVPGGCAPLSPAARRG
jgi:hypothetical protein